MGASPQTNSWARSSTPSSSVSSFSCWWWRLPRRNQRENPRNPKEKSQSPNPNLRTCLRNIQKREGVGFAGGTSPVPTVPSASSMSTPCRVATLCITSATRNLLRVVPKCPATSTPSPPPGADVTKVHQKSATVLSETVATYPCAMLTPPVSTRRNYWAEVFFNASATRASLAMESSVLTRTQEL